MSSQYLNYQTVCPFNNSFPGPVNLSWESYPSYATCILPLNSAFFNKLGADLSSLTKMIVSNNQNLVTTLKVLFFPYKKIDKISSSLEEADNEVKEKISLLKRD